MTILQLPFWEYLKSLSAYPEHFDNEMYWLFVVISILVLILIALLLYCLSRLAYNGIDFANSSESVLLGVIIDKRYHGEQSSTSVGTVATIGSNGVPGVGVISTSSSSDEEFLFFIKSDQIYKIEVDMQQFYNFNIGDKVSFSIKIGRLSNSIVDISFIGRDAIWK